MGNGQEHLLEQVRANLDARKAAGGIETAWFNAWTADSGDALEGLIKSVLERLDRNIVRRWVRAAMARRRVLGFLWAGLAIISPFFGISRLVDELWKQLALDTQSRNRLRDDIRAMLSEWVRQPGRPSDGRCMVVFIDDLDRCSDDVVVQVCEAVKLYLDAPGLIFVMACDESVLARGVASSARGGTEEGRSYLEKIVQIMYRVPPPDDASVRELIRGYAAKSRTNDLITGQVADTLAESTGRNPRKIKRIINSFILERQLSPAWRSAPLSNRHLVTVILLQHLYTPFYNLLVRDDSGPDPIGELLEYADIRAVIVHPAHPDFDQASFDRRVDRFFEDHQVVSKSPGEALTDALKRLEQRLPEEFPRLAGNEALMNLLRGLGDEETRKALRTQLFRHPLGTESPHSPAPPPANDLSGMYFISVDDHPENNAALIRILEELGAEVDSFSDEALGERAILRHRPDAVICDITRGPDQEAGLTAAQRLRDAGYTGLIVFFTARVTPERRERAASLGAVMVTSEVDVIRVLASGQGMG